MNTDYSLYFVTDRESLNPKYDFVNSVEEAILGGATIIQLREKNSSTIDFYKTALKCKEICEKYSVPLIINDRIDIAMAIDAQGVHMGQEDLPMEIVRSLIGENKIVGISVSNVKEALMAEKSGADYLGVGAMFPTETKSSANITQFKELEAIRAAVKIPIVAIGGINEKTMPKFSGYNVDGIAVISAITASNNIRQATKNLKQMFYNTQKLECIIFDLDGTLLESIGMWDRLIESFLAEFNLEITEEFRKKLWELNFEEAAKYTKAYYKLNISNAEILEKWAVMAKEEYTNNINLKLGGKEILELAHKKGLKLAVATSLPRDWFIQCLEKNEVLKYFHIYSIEDLNLNYKDVQIYEKILADLKVKPINTLVIDDEINIGKVVKLLGARFYLMAGEKYIPNVEELRFIDETIVDMKAEVLINVIGGK